MLKHGQTKLISEETRENIYLMLKKRMSFGEISRILGVSTTAIGLISKAYDVASKGDKESVSEYKNSNSFRKQNWDWAVRKTGYYDEDQHQMSISDFTGSNLTEHDNGYESHEVIIKLLKEQNNLLAAELSSIKNALVELLKEHKEESNV